MSSDELGKKQVTDRSEDDGRQRMQFSRQCFHSVETFLETRAGHPAGHPDAAAAVRDVGSTLDAYFDHAPALPVLLQRDGFYDFQTEHSLWETETAIDIAESLRDAGIGLVGIRQGVSLAEVHRLLDLFARCTADNLPFDPVLDLDFDDITLEWLDQSSVQLAGVGADLPAEDSTSVTRATHRLFEREFADRFEDRRPDGPSLLTLFDNRLGRSDRSSATDPPPMPGPDAGGPGSTTAVAGADNDAPIEVRRAETFRTLLEEGCDENARRQIAENAAAGLVRLLGNNRFGEAGQCLDILTDVDAEFTSRFRETIDSELDDHRRKRIAELLVVTDAETRELLLQFADRLRSPTVTQLFASTVKWDIPDATAGDVLRFLQTRGNREFHQLVNIVEQLTTERAGQLIDAAVSGLPERRSFLQELLRLEIPPPLKSRILEAMQGHWKDRNQMLDVVRPLVGTPDATLRGDAIETISRVAPEAIEEILDPYVSETLARRDEADLGNIVRAYAEYGGSKALRKIEDLIRVKRFASEERCRLSVQIVDALADLEFEELETMFSQIADDWLIAASVRDACKSARGPANV